MSFLKKLLSLEAWGALSRGVFLKIRWGNKISFPLTSTYFSSGFRLSIVGEGRVVIKSGAGDARVFFSRNCSVTVSNGQVNIGAGVFFNEGCRLVSHQSIEIGADCLFGPNVSIYDSDHSLIKPSVLIRKQGYSVKPVTIQPNCWLGTNAVVLKGTSLVSGSVVAANSVIRGRCQVSGVYAGNPAAMIRNLSV